MERHATFSVYSATDTTVGAVSLVHIHALGSAADSTLTLLDGADRRMVVPIVSALPLNIFISRPAAFENLVTDMTGTASYSVVFVPRP